MINKSVFFDERFFRDEIDRLELGIDDNASNISLLERKHDDLTASVKSIQASLERNDDEVTKLADSVSFMEECQSDYSVELKEVETHLDETATQVDELDWRLENIEVHLYAKEAARSLSNVKEEPCIAAAKLMHEMNSSISLLQHRSENMAADNATLRKNIQEQAHMLDKLSDSYLAIVTNISSLRKEVEIHTSDVNAINAVLDQVFQEINILKADMNEMFYWLKKLKSQKTEC